MQSYILKGGKIYAQNDFEAKDIVVKDNVISAIVDDAKAAAFNLTIIELRGDYYIDTWFYRYPYPWFKRS